ncbi:MAG: transcriptional regulator [Clostridia bacterium]|nr:transcriptional regulator [Clostridia bacterium]
MELIRIGDKLISLRKINSTLEKIFALRMEGCSQQEVANRLQIDRTFVSRLESIGEVRKGSRIAVVGFPVLNKEELLDVLKENSVEFQLLMTEEERQQFITGKSGAELLSDFMEIVAQVREYDVVVILGSNYRIKISEAMLDREVVGMVIGDSPITKDVYVDPAKLRELLASLAVTEKRRRAK